MGDLVLPETGVCTKSRWLRLNLDGTDITLEGWEQAALGTGLATKTPLLGRTWRLFASQIHRLAVSSDPGLLLDTQGQLWQRAHLSICARFGKCDLLFQRQAWLPLPRLLSLRD